MDSRIIHDLQTKQKTSFAFMKKILILTIVLFTLLLSGCKTRTIIQEVERIKIEYKDRFRVDSIYNSDTTLIYSKSDTVHFETIKWRNKYQFIRDSVLLIDSIPYPVEVVEYVNVLTKWQKMRLQILNILGGLIAIYGAFKIGRLTKLF